jgi:hypothetical protein
MQTFNYIGGEKLKNEFAGYVVWSDSQPFISLTHGRNVTLKKYPNSEDVFVKVDVHGAQCLGHDEGNVLWKMCTWDDDSLRWSLQESASPSKGEWPNFGLDTIRQAYKLTLEVNNSKCALSNCPSADIAFKLEGCENQTHKNGFVFNGLMTMKNFQDNCDDTLRSGGSQRACIIAEERSDRTKEKNSDVKELTKLSERTASLTWADCDNLKNQQINWIGSASSYHAVVDAEIVTTTKWKQRTKVYDYCKNDMWGNCEKKIYKDTWPQKSSTATTWEKRCLEVMGEEVSIRPCASTPSQRWTVIPW